MRFDKSMLDEAYDVLSAAKGSLSFSELVSKVAADLEMSEEESKARLGSFYTEISLDGRFVALTDNNWDLRSRHSYEKVHIDVKDVYTDVEESEEDAEDAEEEKEYNALVEGKAIVKDEETVDGEEEGDSKKTTLVDDIEGTGLKKEDF